MRRVSAKYLYTIEPELFIKDGFVEFEDDGTVIRIGKSDDIDSEEVYYDGAVVPGFVNSHCHIELSHLKGRFMKGSGMAGFIDQINELRDVVGPEEKKVLLKEQMQLLWEQGVSAMADISNCSDSFAAKASSPMYIRTFVEVFGTEPEDCASVLASARELVEVADSYGIDASVTPHACYTMSPELLSGASAEGLARGYISYHSQESDQEEEMIRTGTGAMADNRRRAGMSMPVPTGGSSLEYFIDRLGKVTSFPTDANILLVHNVCLSASDSAIAKKVMRNVYWAVCPMSNRFISGTVPPLKMMREQGLKITVGTDSLSSNDRLVMLDEFRCIMDSYPEISLGEMLQWACLNGAEYLSKQDKLGSIVPGKQPGLVFIDNLAPNGQLTHASVSKRII